jgi:hypothetical protein
MDGGALASLAKLDRIVFRPEPGDLLVLNGSYIHAVRSPHGWGVRLLLNLFAGHVNASTIATWT